MPCETTSVLVAARALISDHPQDYLTRLPTLPGFADLSPAEQDALRRAPAQQIADYLATAETRGANSARAARIA